MTTETLANGQVVRDGDLVCCPGSDGRDMVGKVKRRQYDTPLSSPHGRDRRATSETTAMAGTLYFCNTSFLLTDYAGLRRIM